MFSKKSSCNYQTWFRDFRWIDDEIEIAQEIESAEEVHIHKEIMKVEKFRKQVKAEAEGWLAVRGRKAHRGRTSNSIRTGFTKLEIPKFYESPKEYQNAQKVFANANMKLQKWHLNSLVIEKLTDNEGSNNQIVDTERSFEDETLDSLQKCKLKLLVIS